MKLEELNAIHGDAGNWYLWFFYFAPSDPRMVVKKRLRGFGWTINFARPLAIPLVILLAAAVWMIFDRLSYLQLSETLQWSCVLLLIVSIAALCSWLADPRRFTR